MDQASLRVLRWRVDGLIPRLGQAVLICALLWLQIHSWLAFAWLAACMSASPTRQNCPLLPSKPSIPSSHSSSTSLAVGPWATGQKLKNSIRFIAS